MRIRRPFLSSIAGAALLLTLFAASASRPSGAAATAPTQGWTTVEAPLPGDAGTNPDVYVASSTCPALNGCVSVGDYEDTSAKWWGVIETQTGTTWTETEAPEPSGAGSGTDQYAKFGGSNCGVFQIYCMAVSCPSATFCVAVGQYENSTAFMYPLIDTFSNGSWSATTPPASPAGAATEASTHEFSGLVSVDCTSPTSCVAVGHYITSTDHAAGLIEVLSGTTWTATTAPVPSNADTTSDPFAELYNVSCSSSSYCVASGQYDDMSDLEDGLLETWNGTSWAAAATPLPANAGTDADTFLFAEPFSVVCNSPTACQVVGIYNDTTGHRFGLIDSWNGTAWTATEAPEPTGAGTGSSQTGWLDGLSCPTAADCVAIGFYSITSSEVGALVETLSGGTWTAAQGPLPSTAATSGTNTGSFLDSVDCPTLSFCQASGDYYPTGGGTAGLVDTYAAGQWTAVAAPQPNNAKTGTTASGVAKSSACYSPTSCIVSGFYMDSSGNTQGYLDTYTGVQGYWLGASDGGVFGFGNTGYFGSVPGQLKPGQVLNMPIVGMAATPDGQGYWMVASDGGIFGFGDAGYEGGTGGTHLNEPIVGMAATPDGKGYWLVASDGGIFAEGDATFYGSTGNIKLNKPIVGMAATPDGKGYWLVASDGGIFTFGDATFLGSTGNIHLNKPIVGMASDPNGDGYWLVASDGGIFTFGNAQFYGSTGAIVLNKPIVAMAPSPSGLGYWLVASDGGIFTEGDAQFYGSTGAIMLNKPIVAMAT